MATSADGFLQQELEKALRAGSVRQLRSWLQGAAAKHRQVLIHLVMEMTLDQRLPATVRWPMRCAALLQGTDLTHRHAEQEFSQLRTELDALIGSGNVADAWRIIRQIMDFESAHTNKAIRDPMLLTVTELLHRLVQQVYNLPLYEDIYDFLRSFLLCRYELTPPVVHQLLECLWHVADNLKQLPDIQDLVQALQKRNRNQNGQIIDLFEEVILLRMQYRLWTQRGQWNEAETIIKNNIWVPEFADQFFRRSLSAEELQHAYAVIQDFKTAYMLSTSQALQLDAIHLEVALRQGRRANVRKLAYDLFVRSGFDPTYWRLMKRQYTPASWAKQLPILLERLQQLPHFYPDKVDLLAQLLADEERRTDLLAEYLAKHTSLPLVRRYAPYLRTHFARALIDLYAKAIRRFAEQHLGYEAYQSIREALEEMSVLPEGKNVVQALLVELKVTYGHRRALLHLLNEMVV